MRLNRRLCAWGCALLCALTATPLLAQPPQYPSRPITLVVGYPPGGSTDLTARIVSEDLAKVLGATVVIENQGGAGGGVAAQRVAKATPDGYTLMLASNNELVINQYVNKQLKVDGQKDFTPLGLIASQPLVLVATAKAGVRSLQDFIDTAKRDPGKYSYGSAGIGTSLHLLGELMKDKAHLDILHVPYKGAAPLMTDLLGNNIEYGVFVLSSGLQHIRSGAVVPLATSEAKRSPLTPNIPALAEHSSFKGVDVSAWFMLVGPAGLPAPVSAQLTAALLQALKRPGLQQKLAESGSTVAETQPDLRAYLAAESAKFRQMVTVAKVVP